jgi:hypothetical protein
MLHYWPDFSSTCIFGVVQISFVQAAMGKKSPGLLADTSPQLSPTDLALTPNQAGMDDKAQAKAQAAQEAARKQRQLEAQAEQHQKAVAVQQKAEQKAAAELAMKESAKAMAAEDAARKQRQLEAAARAQDSPKPVASPKPSTPVPELQPHAMQQDQQAPVVPTQEAAKVPNAWTGMAPHALRAAVGSSPASGGVSPSTAQLPPQRRPAWGLPDAQPQSQKSSSVPSSAASSQSATPVAAQSRSLESGSAATAAAGSQPRAGKLVNVPIMEAGASSARGSQAPWAKSQDSLDMFGAPSGGGGEGVDADEDSEELFCFVPNGLNSKSKATSKTNTHSQGAGSSESKRVPAWSVGQPWDSGADMANPSNAWNMLAAASAAMPNLLPIDRLDRPNARGEQFERSDTAWQTHGGKSAGIMKFAMDDMFSQATPSQDFDLACEPETTQEDNAHANSDAARQTDMEDKGPVSPSDALKNMLGIGLGFGASLSQAPAPAKLPVWGQVDITADPAIAKITKAPPPAADVPLPSSASTLEAPHKAPFEQHKHVQESAASVQGKSAKKDEAWRAPLPSVPTAVLSNESRSVPQHMTPRQPEEAQQTAMPPSAVHHQQQQQQQQEPGLGIPHPRAPVQAPPPHEFAPPHAQMDGSMVPPPSVNNMPVPSPFFGLGPLGSQLGEGQHQQHAQHQLPNPGLHERDMPGHMPLGMMSGHGAAMPPGYPGINMNMNLNMSMCAQDGMRSFFDGFPGFRGASFGQNMPMDRHDGFRAPPMIGGYSPPLHFQNPAALKVLGLRMRI